MLCSSGGEICTAAKPAGPRTVSHSVAMSVHFQSKRWTNTSPAAMWPLGRYVWGRTGRPGGTETTGAVDDEPHAAASASSATKQARLRRHDDGAAVRINLLALCSVARVLVQVRVRDELGCRERVQVPERLRRRPHQRPTLPLPQLATAGEQPVADQVRPTVAFP